MLNSSCQTCGEILLPDDVDKLRQFLGVSASKPPEIENPVIESTPEAIPDSVDCPNCNTPLMGDDLANWESGSCIYCGEPNNAIGSTITQSDNIEPTHSHPDNRESIAEDSEIIISPDGELDFCSMIINVGPMVGQSIKIPMGKPIGRNELAKLLNDPWYQGHLNRVSSEHFMVIIMPDTVILENYTNDKIGVMDLGSTNGTYILGERITGTSATELRYGYDLNIGGNIQMTLELAAGANPPVAGFFITHDQSGVRWGVEGDTQHLGRLDSNGEMERWAAMADLQLRAMAKDESIIAYISRRHMEVILDDGRIKVNTFEGKEEPEFNQITGAKDVGPYFITLGKNSFLVEF